MRRGERLVPDFDVACGVVAGVFLLLGGIGPQVLVTFDTQTPRGPTPAAVLHEIDLKAQEISLTPILHLENAWREPRVRGVLDFRTGLTDFRFLTMDGDFSVDPSGGEWDATDMFLRTCLALAQGAEPRMTPHGHWILTAP